MKRRIGLASATATIIVIAATAAQAKTLPAIKTGGSNAVPECATPGRLMAFIATRNAKLDPRFASIATSYMRHGEQFGLRWDYAFFQMILETGNLSYTRDGTRPGDVKPRQNNFAGLGATGKGEPGESFATVDDGVKAHLQHLLMYSGETVEAPVAERTRKVQEWGVLTSWQKGFKRPITFSDLAGKWAPGSRGYASNVDSIASDFYDDHCAKADPRPELVQEARAGRAAPTQRTAAAAAAPAAKAAPAAERSKGEELARQALERARAEGGDSRSGLGAKAIVAAKPYGGESAPSPGFTILNEQKAEEAAPAAAAAVSKPAASAAPAGPAQAAEPATKATAPFQTASAAGAARAPSAKSGTQATNVAAAASITRTPPAPTPPPAAAASKCRVYTASYGGQKAVIIRANADQYTNFTVLDVNEGQEAREIEAYISAYAKGGQKVGDFSSSNAALDTAFQLCPEG